MTVAALLSLLPPGTSIHAAAPTFPNFVRWSVASDAPPSGAPIVVQSVLVVPLQTGSIAGHHLGDGRPLWKEEIAADHPLAGDDTRVYVAAGDTVHALDAASGARTWQVAAGGRLTAPPLAHAGWVIAAAAGDLIALRAQDGAVLWRARIGLIEFRPALDGDLLVVSVVDGRVVALDLPTGKTRWEKNLGSEPAEPFVIGDRVYAGVKGKSFYSLYASSGRIDFHKSTAAEPRGRAAADERHVYFAGMDNLLTALDRRSGSLAWKRPLDYRPGAGPSLVGGLVMVPGYTETPLPAFDAGTGKPAGTVAFGGLLTALPAFAELADGTPVVVGITGGLANKWTISLFAPLVIPDLPAIERLTQPPGELLPPARMPGAA